MNEHEISEKIATEVIGWKLIDQRYYTKDDSITSYGTWKTEEGSCIEWKPCSDIFQAWYVLEKWKWAEPEVSWSDEQHTWTCEMRKSPGCAGAGTAPMAICLAVLKAAGIQLVEQ